MTLHQKTSILMDIMDATINGISMLIEEEQNEKEPNGEFMVYLIRLRQLLADTKALEKAMNNITPQTEEDMP